MMQKSLQGIAVIASLALLSAVGCSHKESARPSGITAQRMETLATCYSMYAGRHQGHIPTDEVALKNFIRTECKYVLSKNEITDPDSLFVSDRDTLPLAVTYAQGSMRRELVPEMIIAREQTGVGGKRLVAVGSGFVREFDEATFAELNRNTQP